MRAAKRSEDFRTVQRESTQVMAVLQKALFSLRLVERPSPAQGGLPKPPSPSGGSGRRLVRVIATNRMGLEPYNHGRW